MKYNMLKKSILMIFSIFLVTVLIYGCGENKTGKIREEAKKNETSENTSRETKMENSGMNDTKEMNENMNSDHIMIALTTMQCGTCKNNIESAVNKLDGIESINVDKKEKVAHINYDKSKLNLIQIETAITAAGYDANDKKADPKAYENLDDCCKLPEDQKNKN